MSLDKCINLYNQHLHQDIEQKVPSISFSQSPLPASNSYFLSPQFTYFWISHERNHIVRSHLCLTSLVQHNVICISLFHCGVLFHCIRVIFHCVDIKYVRMRRGIFLSEMFLRIQGNLYRAWDFLNPFIQPLKIL